MRKSTVRPDPALLWLDLAELLDRAKSRFRLPAGIRLEPVRRRYTHTRMDGNAHRYPPRIQLRLHRVNRPRRAVSPSTIMATLAHEIAHFVRGGWDHGPTHRKHTREVAAWIREQGYPVAPRLFSGTLIGMDLTPRRRANKLVG